MQETDQLSCEDSKDGEADLKDFENHRRNIRDGTGLVKSIDPLSKNKIKINIGLVHGQTEFSEVFNTKEVERILNQEGYNPRVTNVADIEGDSLDVHYINDEWRIEKEFGKDDEEKGENATDIYYKSKGMVIISILSTIVVSFLSLLAILNGFILAGGAIFVTMVFINTIIGVNYQTSTRLYIENTANGYRRLAPASQSAYDASYQSYTSRVFHAMTVHIFKQS